MTDLLIRSALLGGVPGLHHGFSRADLDLGRAGPPGDPARLLAALGLPDADLSRPALALAAQVHGRAVLRPSSPGLAGEADALVTDTPGLVLAIRTADCVPILLFSEASGEVAAVHAGWRGVAAGVLPATLQQMRSLPSHAAVGPCISALHYEVGEEVVDAIAQAGVPTEVFARRDLSARGRPHADLRAAVAWQLRQAAPGCRIDVLPHCTFADRGLHSHRRDGERSGRLAAAIGLAP